MANFQNTVIEWLKSGGWQVSGTGEQLVAEREDILSKWLLGSRRVRLRLNMKFDLPTQTLHFEEIAIEQSRGMPPPTLSLTVSTQRGMNLTENRSDVGLGGGGKMHYGSARQWLEQECIREGWSFKLEIGSPF